VQYPLLAYHAEQHQLLSPAWIAGLYAIAMGADSLAALLFGKWYDRFSIRILWGVPLLTTMIATGAFQDNVAALVGAALVWGMTMALHETVLRAFIADAIDPGGLAFAYGIFNTVYCAQHRGCGRNRKSSRAVLREQKLLDQERNVVASKHQNICAFRRELGSGNCFRPRYKIVSSHQCSVQ